MSGLFGNKADGLSINTGSANSLFGNSNNNNSNQTSQAPTGNLFGSGTAATSKPGGIFGSTTSTAASAGTLFGTSTATTTQGGSLFGSTAAAPASNAGTLFGGAASQGGGLFGQKPATSQPQQSGGMFGQSTAQGGGGLFGNSTAQPQQQQSGGLFGNTASQPQQPGMGLFGNTTTSQPQQSGGLFSSLGGQQQQAQNKPTNSIFGASTQPTQTPQKPNYSQTTSTLYPTQNPQRSAFSASIGQYTAAAQAIPGVRIDLSNLRPTTRFEDLHESLQKEIIDLDSFILKQIQYNDECAAFHPNIVSLTSTIPSDVEYVERKVLGAQQCLETNAATIEDARALTKGDANDARRSFKAIHALKMPAQYHVAGSWASSSSLPGALAEGESVDSEKESADLVRYFSGQADEMGKKLEALKKNMGQVEDYVKGLETQIREQGQRIRTGRAGDQGPKTADEKIRELAGVLREFEGGILTVAGSVGGAREQVQEIMLSESRAGRWSRR